MSDSLSFATVYVDDYKKACDFYRNTLGLKKKFDWKNGKECFFRIGEKDWGLYLQAGNKKRKVDSKTTRTSFVLSVKSAFKMHKKLKKSRVKLVQQAPLQMGEGDYWFQFYDPAGNILEVLGGK